MNGWQFVFLVAGGGALVGLFVAAFLVIQALAGNHLPASRRSAVEPL